MRQMSCSAEKKSVAVAGTGKALVSPASRSAADSHTCITQSRMANTWPLDGGSEPGVMWKGSSRDAGTNLGEHLPLAGVGSGMAYRARSVTASASAQHTSSVSAVSASSGVCTRS
jgi:hypothetical protein